VLTMAALFTIGAVVWPIVLGGLLILGIAYSTSVTPSGRLLRRSANAEDRPALFAAQFALSHGFWLITYPLAGQIGAHIGMKAAFAALAAVAGIGTITALRLWPVNEANIVPHTHDELPADHPHLRNGHKSQTGHHFVIDDLHTNWPAVPRSMSGG